MSKKQQKHNNVFKKILKSINFIAEQASKESKNNFAETQEDTKKNSDYSLPSRKQDNLSKQIQSLKQKTMAYKNKINKINKIKTDETQDKNKNEKSI